MQIVILYAVTAVIFLAADAVALSKLLKPLFERHMGDMLREPIALAPAGIFYLAYVAGLLFLVSVPALRAGSPMQALIGGAVLGAVAYGTYEFTNISTLKGWSWEMVATDVTWGTALTGVSAAAGVWITRALS